MTTPTEHRPRRRGRLAALIGSGAVVAAVATVGPCSTPNPVRQACLAPERPVLVASERDESTRWPHADHQIPGRTFDARGRTWSLPGTSNVVKFYRSRTGVDACFVGGMITTDLPIDTPWETWHDHYAFISQQPDTRVEGTTFSYVGDAMSFAHDAQDWEVRNVSVLMAYDDCVQNDGMATGLIVDSVFACGSAFVSATTSNARLNGDDDTVTIENVMVEMVAFENSFNVPRWGQWQHGGFFKWAERTPPAETWAVPPRLVIRDSMFRSDTRAVYGSKVAGGPNGLPDESVCERVTLVGDGWSVAELSSWQSQCTDLRIGTVEDWNAAMGER